MSPAPVIWSHCEGPHSQEDWHVVSICEASAGPDIHRTFGQHSPRSQPWAHLSLGICIREAFAVCSLWDLGRTQLSLHTLAACLPAFRLLDPGTTGMDMLKSMQASEVLRASFMAS